MRVMLDKQIDGDEDEDDSDNPPFHHPLDYVMETWTEHKLHHTYPESGGYNDQDALLMKDWHTVNMYQLRVEKGIYTPLGVPDNAPSWHDLMGD